ncbi:MAG: hypothetical protein AAF694_14575 [Bacteroidota bacterium]
MHSKSEEYLAQQIAELRKKERKAAQKKILTGILIGIGLLTALLGWFFLQHKDASFANRSNLSGELQPSTTPIDNVDISTPIGNEGLFESEDSISSHVDSLYDF